MAILADLCLTTDDGTVLRAPTDLALARTWAEHVCGESWTTMPPEDQCHEVTACLGALRAAFIADERTGDLARDAADDRAGTHTYPVPVTFAALVEQEIVGFREVLEMIRGHRRYKDDVRSSFASKLVKHHHFARVRKRLRCGPLYFATEVQEFLDSDRPAGVHLSR